MPKVSIVTGYYRRAPVVRRTLESLLAQSYHDFEILIFDDASGDGTADAIADFTREAQDARIKPTYFESNVGFVNGIGRMVAAASGDYIAVQGSGDISLPRRVERQAAVLDSRPDIGVVGCHYTNIVEASGIRRPRKPNADGMSLARLVKGNVFSHGEVMYRKDAYLAAGGYRPQFRFCQDYDLWLRLIRITGFSTVPENLYERYISFDGVSYHPEKYPLQARYSLLARHLAGLQPTEETNLLERLEREGILALIPADEPELARRIRAGALRSLVWGSLPEADALAATLARDTDRRIYKLARFLLSDSRRALIMPLLGRALGIAVR